MSLRNLALAALASALIAPAANATVLVSEGNTAGPDNVLFNCALCVQTPNPVTGPVVGSVDGFLVDFTSTSNNLVVDNGGGQAKVQGLGGVDVANISYQMETAVYLRSVFKIEVDPSNSNGTFTIVVTTKDFDGTNFTPGTTYTFLDNSLTGAGGGFFTVFENNLDLLTATEFIDKVTVSADIGSGTGSKKLLGITDLRQIRIGKICSTGPETVCTEAEVPEPMTLALLGPAVLGLGLAARRRRRK
jgi:hypothetical protein